MNPPPPMYIISLFFFLLLLLLTVIVPALFSWPWCRQVRLESRSRVVDRAQQPLTSSQPCPSGEGWCFRDGSTLDTPSSWRGYPHLQAGRWIICSSFSSISRPWPQPWCYSCCRRRWHVVWTWRTVLPPPPQGQSCSAASVAGLTRWCSGGQLSR